MSSSLQSRVLVLGGSGFVGTNLKDSSILDNCEVLSLDIEAPNFVIEKQNWVHQILDCSNADSLLGEVRNYKPELVIHLAANSDIKSGQENSSHDLKNTLLTSLALSEVLEVNPVKGVIFSSTGAVYGNQRTSGQIDDVPNIPISSYGISKLASEKILQNCQNNQKCEKLLLVRFPNVVGKFMTHGIIFDMFTKYKSDQSRLEVLGDGSQAKPYILASDLIEVIFDVYEKLASFVKVEIGPKDIISVNEIMDILSNSLPTRPRISFGTEKIGWPGDVNSYVIDSRELLNMVGDLNLRSSREAIELAVEFHLAERLKIG